MTRFGVNKKVFENHCYMPLIPLWSAIILTTVNPESNVSTYSNASVENKLASYSKLNENAL